MERNHGTHQDRLVKKLRRLAIAEDAAANAFLETTYWPQHNARFAQAPAAAADFHRRCPSATRLDRVFRLEETRTIGHDWVVRYHNRALQLARQSSYAPARGTVTVCEWPDGLLAVEYRGRTVLWTEITSPPSLSPAANPTEEILAAYASTSDPLEGLVLERREPPRESRTGWCESGRRGQSIIELSCDG